MLVKMEFGGLNNFLAIVVGNVVKQFSDAFVARLFVGRPKVGHAGFLRVDGRAAQVLGAYVHEHYALYDLGAGDEKLAYFVNGEDKVRQAGRVDRSARARAGHD